MPVSPSEADLTDALIDLKTRDPHLGISKIHALLLQHYPDWLVSEKRTRKILQAKGLTIVHSSDVEKTSDLPSNVPKIPYVPKYTSNEYTSPASGAPRAPLPPLEYPTSKVISSLDVSQWTPKVSVKWFDSHRGKGLVATEAIEEGEVIWREDPFVLAPEWEIWELQMNGVACGFCSTPLDVGSPLAISCPSASSSTATTNPSTACSIRFCNRLCLARSSKVHPLLCTTQNPASVPLLKYARDCHWMALHALAHVTSRILLVNQHSEEAMRKDREVVESWAVLGMRERVKCSYLGYTL